MGDTADRRGILDEQTVFFLGHVVPIERVENSFADIV
jgi:hypothetical protein